MISIPPRFPLQNKEYEDTYFLRRDAMTMQIKQPTESQERQQAAFHLKQKIGTLDSYLQETILEEFEKGLAGERLLLMESQQASIEELAGNIAHQWRQPLNILGLTVQKLQFDFEKKEVNARYVEELVREVLCTLKQMSRTVQSFRNFMQTEAGKQQFDLNESIIQVLSFVDGSMKSAGIKVNLNASGDDFLIDNYRNELSRIVLRLLNKSKKVLRQNKTENPRIELKLFRSGKRRVLTVYDNGGCIAESEIGRAFEPGSVSGLRGAGTGMELHLAKFVIENKMDGLLKVRNRAGGVEFRIEL